MPDTTKSRPSSSEWTRSGAFVRLTGRSFHVPNFPEGEWRASTKKFLGDCGAPTNEAIKGVIVTLTFRFPSRISLLPMQSRPPTFQLHTSYGLMRIHDVATQRPGFASGLSFSIQNVDPSRPLTSKHLTNRLDLIFSGSKLSGGIGAVEAERCRPETWAETTALVHNSPCIEPNQSRKRGI